MSSCYVKLLDTIPVAFSFVTPEPHPRGRIRTVASTASTTDQLNLRQVSSNLLNNALEFMKQGRVVLPVYGWWSTLPQTNPLPAVYTSNLPNFLR